MAELRQGKRDARTGISGQSAGERCLDVSRDILSDDDRVKEAR
jgi:hypothetical protein